MLITDRERLREYDSAHRKWQGIPGVERTVRGRMFACFYSGEETEQNGNFAAVLMSEDGEHFSEPIAVADVGKDSRAFDSALWIDPLGRLWFIWAVMPECRVEFSICAEPDAPELVWSPVRVLAHDIMLNKPIVAKKRRLALPRSRVGARPRGRSGLRDRWQARDRRACLPQPRLRRNV